MSAAAKLEALHATITRGSPWEKGHDDPDEVVDVVNALPQIVALVGVVEGVLSDLDRGRSAATPQIGRDIRAALCALDDALTAGGSG